MPSSSVPYPIPYIKGMIPKLPACKTHTPATAHYLFYYILKMGNSMYGLCQTGEDLQLRESEFNIYSISVSYSRKTISLLLSELQIFQERKRKFLSKYIMK